MDVVNWLITTGCSNLGGGCDSCPSLWEYREKNQDYSIKLHPDLLSLPLLTNDQTCFVVCLGSDLFHEDVPDDFIKQAFDVMNNTPNHKYELPTKRIKRAVSMSQDLKWTDNIELAITVESEDQKWRVDYLKKVPVKMKSVSFIPLLGPVGAVDLEGIEYVGISAELWGLKRPFDGAWQDEIEKQCDEQGVRTTPYLNMYTY